MIANLNTFFKNITKRPFYVFSFLALPIGLYLFNISNKFKNIIEPIEEIIDEDELMESESKEEEIIDEDELMESESKEEENESDFGGTYFLSNIPEYPEEESNNENIFSRFVNYMIFREKV